MLSHLVLLVFKFCKVGHRPRDKSGQRSCRMKAQVPIHLLLTHIHFNSKTYPKTATRFVNRACMYVPLSLLILCCVWLSVFFTNTLKWGALDLSILISVGFCSLITEQRTVRTKKKRGLTKLRKLRAFCLDVKSFSLLSVLGQVHCHHSWLTWMENTESA